MLASPYLLLAALLTLVMEPLWSKGGWWDVVISVMPNVLGFSIGGFAIFLAFGDGGFRRLIAGRHDGDLPDEASPYLVFSSTFLHFIAVQVVAILAGVLAKSFYSYKLESTSRLIEINEAIKPVWWGLAFLFFCYAICLALATAVAIFSLSISFDDYVTDERKSEEESQKCCCKNEGPGERES